MRPMTKTRKKKAVSCSTCDCAASELSLGTRWAQALVWFVCAAAVYAAFQQFGFISFTGTTQGVAGLGAIFLIGVTASVSSCLAMVGGLLLSVSAKWSESHAGLSRLQKLQPLVSFNAGRIIGYFVFGGLTGLLGHSLFLSVIATGYIKIVLAIVMIILGLNILHLIPKKYCSVPLPRSVMKHLHGLSDSDSIFAPTILGALTFFVPCGYTQSMQLLALGTGNFLQGGLIMFIFALGTLPALAGISAASSFAEGRAGRAFFTFAGTISVFLGVLSFGNGMALANISLPSLIPCCSAIELTEDPNVTVDQNGQQIIAITVRDEGFSSNSFTVKAGMKTWIYANAPEQLTGCISQMAVPEFNIQQPISKGQSWVGPFTPTKDFAIMCSMGMFRTEVRVRS